MASQIQQTVALEKILKALADRTRLRIIGLLVAGEVCVCHIHESLGITQPKASRHLAYLRRVGLVAARKDGLWVHYRLAELREPVLQAVLEAVAHAVGHLPLASRDRQRLAAKVELTAPMRVMPGGSCCTPVASSR
jgi:ArsR family transcriptional regulator, arsenate/arsenite/antimonite-responsive transcriptional repressor